MFTFPFLSLDSTIICTGTLGKLEGELAGLHEFGSKNKKEINEDNNFNNLTN